MFSRLRSDIRCILERDPAARSAWEVLTLYPGLHAVVLHRAAHWCWTHRLRWVGRAISQASRWLTGIEIHPGAKLGERVFFDHAMGVVVGETAEIGDGCTIYQGVTLGGTSLYKGTKRHPTLGRDVVVSAGAKVLGGFTVGEGAKIGSNAVVVKAVPAGGTAVGNPARVIRPNAPKDDAQARRDDQGRKAEFSAYGIAPNADDPVSLAIHGLIENATDQAHKIDVMVAALNQLGAHLEALGASKIDTAELRKLGKEIQDM